jgi:hypothetical protein
VTIDHVWHFDGEASVPPQLRRVPLELYDGDLVGLSVIFDVMIYRDEIGKLVLALDARGKRQEVSAAMSSSTKGPMSTITDADHVARKAAHQKAADNFIEEMDRRLLSIESGGLGSSALFELRGKLVRELRDLLVEHAEIVRKETRHALLDKVREMIDENTRMSW